MILEIEKNKGENKRQKEMEIWIQEKKGQQTTQYKVVFYFYENKLQGMHFLFYSFQSVGKQHSPDFFAMLKLHSFSIAIVTVL